MVKIQTTRPVSVPTFIGRTVSQILSESNVPALIRLLENFTVAYNFEKYEEKSLYNWIDLLNKFDSILEAFVMQDPISLLIMTSCPIPDDQVSSSSHVPSVESIQLVKQVLSVSFLIVSHSSLDTRVVYGSTDRLSLLVCSEHYEIANLAMSIIYELLKNQPKSSLTYLAPIPDLPKVLEAFATVGWSNEIGASILPYLRSCSEDELSSETPYIVDLSDGESIPSDITGKAEGNRIDIRALLQAFDLNSGNGVNSGSRSAFYAWVLKREGENIQRHLRAEAIVKLRSALAFHDGMEFRIRHLSLRYLAIACMALLPPVFSQSLKGGGSLETMVGLLGREPNLVSDLVLLCQRAPGSHKSEEAVDDNSMDSEDDAIDDAAQQDKQHHVTVQAWSELLLRCLQCLGSICSLKQGYSQVFSSGGLAFHHGILPSFARSCVAKIQRLDTSLRRKTPKALPRFSSLVPLASSFNINVFWALLDLLSALSLYGASHLVSVGMLHCLTPLLELRSKELRGTQLRVLLTLEWIVENSEAGNGAAIFREIGGPLTLTRSIAEECENLEYIIINSTLYPDHEVQFASSFVVPENQEMGSANMATASVALASSPRNFLSAQDSVSESIQAMFKETTLKQATDERLEDLCLLQKRCSRGLFQGFHRDLTLDDLRSRISTSSMSRGFLFHSIWSYLLGCFRLLSLSYSGSGVERIQELLVDSGNVFLQAARDIMARPFFFGAALFSDAAVFITDLAHAEPTCLGLFMDSGICHGFLSAVARGLPPTSEVFNVVPGLIVAFCLSERGLQEVHSRKVLEPYLLGLVSPFCSRSIPKESYAPLSNSLDELVRHVPSLRSEMHSAISSCLTKAFTFACGGVSESFQRPEDVLMEYGHRWGIYEAADASTDLSKARDELEHAVIFAKTKLKVAYCALRICTMFAWSICSGSESQDKMIADLLALRYVAALYQDNSLLEAKLRVAYSRRDRDRKVDPISGKWVSYKDILVALISALRGFFLGSKQKATRFLFDSFKKDAIRLLEAGNHKGPIWIDEELTGMAKSGSKALENVPAGEIGSRSNINYALSGSTAEASMAMSSDSTNSKESQDLDKWVRILRIDMLLIIGLCRNSTFINSAWVEQSAHELNTLVGICDRECRAQLSKSRIDALLDPRESSGRGSLAVWTRSRLAPEPVTMDSVTASAVGDEIMKHIPDEKLLQVESTLLQSIGGSSSTSVEGVRALIKDMLMKRMLKEKRSALYGMPKFREVSGLLASLALFVSSCEKLYLAMAQVASFLSKKTMGSRDSSKRSFGAQALSSSIARLFANHFSIVGDSELSCFTSKVGLEETASHISNKAENVVYSQEPIWNYLAGVMNVFRRVVFDESRSTCRSMILEAFLRYGGGSALRQGITTACFDELGRLQAGGFREISRAVLRIPDGLDMSSALLEYVNHMPLSVMACLSSGMSALLEYSDFVQASNSDSTADPPLCASVDTRGIPCLNRLPTLREVDDIRRDFQVVDFHNLHKNKVLLTIVSVNRACSQYHALLQLLALCPGLKNEVVASDAQWDFRVLHRSSQLVAVECFSSTFWGFRKEAPESRNTAILDHDLFFAEPEMSGNFLWFWNIIEMTADVLCIPSDIPAGNTGPEKKPNPQDPSTALEMFVREFEGIASRASSGSQPPPTLSGRAADPSLPAANDAGSSDIARSGVQPANNSSSVAASPSELTPSGNDLDESSLGILCDMGFTRERATYALRRFSNLEAAADWLLAHGDDPIPSPAIASHPLATGESQQEQPSGPGDLYPLSWLGGSPDTVAPFQGGAASGQVQDDPLGRRDWGLFSSGGTAQAGSSPLYPGSQQHAPSSGYIGVFATQRRLGLASTPHTVPTAQPPQESGSNQEQFAEGFDLFYESDWSGFALLEELWDLSRVLMDESAGQRGVLHACMKKFEAFQLSSDASVRRPIWLGPISSDRGKRKASVASKEVQLKVQGFVNQKMQDFKGSHTCPSFAGIPVYLGVLDDFHRACARLLDELLYSPSFDARAGRARQASVSAEEKHQARSQSLASPSHRFSEFQRGDLIVDMLCLLCKGRVLSATRIRDIGRRLVPDIEAGMDSISDNLMLLNRKGSPQSAKMSDLNMRLSQISVLTRVLTLWVSYGGQQVRSELREIGCVRKIVGLLSKSVPQWKSWIETASAASVSESPNSSDSNSKKRKKSPMILSNQERLCLWVRYAHGITYLLLALDGFLRFSRQDYAASIGSRSIPKPKDAIKEIAVAKQPQPKATSSPGDVASRDFGSVQTPLAGPSSNEPPKPETDRADESRWKRSPGIVYKSLLDGFGSFVPYTMPLHDVLHLVNKEPSLLRFCLNICNLILSLKADNLEALSFANSHEFSTSALKFAHGNGTRTMDDQLTKSLTDMRSAAFQLLTFVTRDTSMCVEFVQSNGLEKIFSLPETNQVHSFGQVLNTHEFSSDTRAGESEQHSSVDRSKYLPKPDGQLFRRYIRSILRNSVEIQPVLLFAMEKEIRDFITTNRSGRVSLLPSFVSSMAPLIDRDASAFLVALGNVARIRPSGFLIPIKDSFSEKDFPVPKKETGEAMETRNGPGESPPSEITVHGGILPMQPGLKEPRDGCETLSFMDLPLRLVPRLVSASGGDASGSRPWKWECQRRTMEKESEKPGSQLSSSDPTTDLKLVSQDELSHLQLIVRLLCSLLVNPSHCCGLDPSHDSSLLAQLRWWSMRVFSLRLLAELADLYYPCAFVLTDKRQELVLDSRRYPLGTALIDVVLENAFPYYSTRFSEYPVKSHAIRFKNPLFAGIMEEVSEGVRLLIHSLLNQGGDVATAAVRALGSAVQKQAVSPVPSSEALLTFSNCITSSALRAEDLKAMIKTGLANSLALSLNKLNLSDSGADVGRQILKSLETAALVTSKNLK